MKTKAYSLNMGHFQSTEQNFLHSLLRVFKLSGQRHLFLSLPSMMVQRKKIQKSNIQRKKTQNTKKKKKKLSLKDLQNTNPSSFVDWQWFVNQCWFTKCTIYSMNTGARLVRLSTGPINLCLYLFIWREDNKQ